MSERSFTLVFGKDENLKKEVFKDANLMFDRTEELIYENEVGGEGLSIAVWADWSNGDSERIYDTKNGWKYTEV